MKIIYLTVNITGVHKNKNEFDNEIKAQLVQKIERIGMMDHPKMRQVIDALEDGTLKLHDISTRIQAEKPVTFSYTHLCLDTHKPDVTRFNIEKKDALKILNIFTFGNYGNGVIKVCLLYTSHCLKEVPNHLKQGKAV